MGIPGGATFLTLQWSMVEEQYFFTRTYGVAETEAADCLARTQLRRTSIHHGQGMLEAISSMA